MRLFEALESDFLAYRWLGLLDKIQDQLPDPAPKARRSGADMAELRREVLASWFKTLRLAVQKDPPKISGTWEDVADAVREAGADEVLLKWLEMRRRRAIRQKFRTRGAASREDQTVLTGWVGPK